MIRDRQSVTGDTDCLSRVGDCRTSVCNDVLRFKRVCTWVVETSRSRRRENLRDSEDVASGVFTEVEKKYSPEVLWCAVECNVIHWFTLIVLSGFERSDNDELAEFDDLLQCDSKEKILIFSWILKDSGEVKEFQRSFRHSDIERLSRSDEVLKLKNFKKDATLKLSKSTNQEWYEHVGPEVTRSQDDKVTRRRNEIMRG
ncbi:hypothetical protein Tco_1060055 [Tanacetum coccineum]